jgi:hypothetical protein
VSTEGVIYGVHIERTQSDGPMRAGPVVTLCLRLPEWVILDSQTEYKFKRELQAAMISAVEVITNSPSSQANRKYQNR